MVSGDAALRGPAGALVDLAQVGLVLAVDEGVDAPRRVAAVEAAAGAARRRRAQPQKHQRQPHLAGITSRALDARPPRAANTATLRASHAERNLHHGASTIPCHTPPTRLSSRREITLFPLPCPCTHYFVRFLVELDGCIAAYA